MEPHRRRADSDRVELDQRFEGPISARERIGELAKRELDEANMAASDRHARLTEACTRQPRQSRFVLAHKPRLPRLQVKPMLDGRE